MILFSIANCFEMSVILPSEFWLFRLYSSVSEAVSSFLDTASSSIDSCILKWSIVANALFETHIDKCDDTIHNEVVKHDFHQHYSNNNFSQIQLTSSRWMENFIRNSMSMVSKDIFNNDLLSELFATLPWDTLLSSLNENCVHKWKAVVWSINIELLEKLYETESIDLDSSIISQLLQFEKLNTERDFMPKFHQFNTESYSHVIFSSSLFPIPIIFHFIALDNSQIHGNFGNFAYNLKEGSELHSSYLLLFNTLYPMIGVFLQSLICATFQVKSKHPKTMYSVYYADSLYKRTVLFQQISQLLPKINSSIFMPQVLPISSILQKYNSYMPVINLVINSYCKSSGFRFWVNNNPDLIDSNNPRNLIEFKDSILSEVYSSVDTDLYPSLQFGFYLDSTRTYTNNNCYSHGSIIVLPVWTKFDTYDTLFGILEIFEPNMLHNKNQSLSLRPLVGLENGIYFLFDSI